MPISHHFSLATMLDASPLYSISLTALKAAVPLVEQTVDAVHHNPGHSFELGPVCFLGFPGEEFEGLRDAELFEPVLHIERIADAVGDGACLREG